MRRYILLVLIVVIAGTAYFTDFFLKKERGASENILLKQQNEGLLAQIQTARIFGKDSEADDFSFVEAKVFSTYPFNIKNTITVSGGENKGIKKNMPALLGKNILIGRVSEVFEEYSVIQTVFDPSWQMSARIGELETDGLLEGGNEPKITLIEKNKPCEAGDIVYSASKEFPYGLKIGEVLKVEDDSAGVFKDAVLKIPFNVGELRTVNILIN
jgi:rod shape-determining protein MreC